MKIFFSVLVNRRQAQYKSCFQSTREVYDSRKNFWGYLIQTKFGDFIEDKLSLNGYETIHLSYPKSHQKTIDVVTLYKNEVVHVNIRVEVNQILYTGFSNNMHFRLQCEMEFPDRTKPSTNFFSVFRDYFYSDTTDIVVDKVTPFITNTKHVSFPMHLLFYYPEWIKQPFPEKGGCLNLGNDQYAIYWIFPNSNVIDFIPKSVYLSNILNIKYFSNSYGFNVETVRQSLPYNIDNKNLLNTFYYIEPLRKQKMFVPNPYLFHNFINSCYLKETSFNSEPRSIQTSQNIVQSGKKVNVYRIDRETSKEIEGDQFRSGECLNSYLFSLVTNADSLELKNCARFNVLYPFGYIQMRVPSSVYNENPPQCTTYPDIDVEYWSLSSNICASDIDLILPFWTVHAQMLYDLSSDVGYILWAPNEEVKKHMTQPGQTTPPIVQLRNGQKAYLLQTPTFAFVFRYRNASIKWKGNPIYAPCCNTFQESLQEGAITNQMIDSNGVNQAPQVFAVDSTSVEDLISKIDV